MSNPEHKIKISRLESDRGAPAVAPQGDGNLLPGIESREREIKVRALAIGSGRTPETFDRNWIDMATEGADPTFSRLREYFNANRGPQQTWYYAGANKDIPSLCLAPASATHLWIDPLYDKNTPHFPSGFSNAGKLIAKPFEEKGIPVRCNNPRLRIPEMTIQEVKIGNHTNINLIGGSDINPHAVKGPIDVVFTNGVSPSPRANAFLQLKTNGFFVVATPAEDQSKKFMPKFQVPNATLERFGFEKVMQEEIVWDLPALNIPEEYFSFQGKKMAIAVYKKTREFSPPEKELLELETYYRDIEDEYMSLIDIGGSNIQKQRRKEFLKRALEKFLDFKKNLQEPQNREIASRLVDELRKYLFYSKNLHKELVEPWSNSGNEAATRTLYIEQAKEIFEEVLRSNRQS